MKRGYLYRIRDKKTDEIVLCTGIIFTGTGDVFEGYTIFPTSNNHDNEWYCGIDKFKEYKNQKMDSEYWYYIEIGHKDKFPEYFL